MCGSLLAQAGRLRWGRAERRLRGEVALLLSRHPTSAEIHPTGTCELQVVKEFGCGLSILTPRDDADSLVRRAGDALDAAKEAARN